MALGARGRMLRVGLQALLWSAALALLVQNLALVRENEELQASIEHPDERLRPGTLLHGLSGIGLDGNYRTVTWPAEGTKLLLITFSPGCPACRENQEGWSELARSLDSRRWTVLWVSRDSVDLTREYCMQKGIPPGEVIADPPLRTYHQLWLERVPNTVVVGPVGVIEKVWPGGLDTPGWGAVYAYVGAGGFGFVPTGGPLLSPPAGCGDAQTQASGSKACK